MTFEEVCQQLNEWIARSNGRPIVTPSGVEYAFRSLVRYTADDLAVFERQWRLSLPPDYRYFLLHVGACEVFVRPDYGVELHRLEEIEERYEGFFESPEDLFSVFLPVAVENHLQEVATFALQVAPPHNFDLYAHDEHPDGWLDNMPRQSFREWINSLVM